ncbi:unnamed protein product [Knipowitschia caucasica]
MAYLRLWRNRRREMFQLLQESSEEESDVDSNNELPLLDADKHGTASGDVSGSDCGSETDLDEDVSGTDLDVADTNLDGTNEESENQSSDLDFEDDLREWAVKNQQTHKSLNELLAILRKKGHKLPADARTLLATPQETSSQTNCGGQYVYYGLERGICRLLSREKHHEAINLRIDIDGIPIFKSSGLQFWPILAKFGHFDPFIVANFCGQKKPTPLEDYLHDFLLEYNRLRDYGVIYKGRSCSV